jgi:hypothetical protein
METAFGTAVAFWLAEESRRGPYPEKAELGLKIRAHKLGAVIVPQPHASRDGFAESTELFLHGLPPWLEGFQPRAAFGCLNAQAIGRIVVDHSEDRHLAILSRKARRRVDAPHLVGPLGEDRAVVALGLDRLRLPPGRQQAVLAHQLQHAPLGRAHARQPQPRPHLAVALAMEGRAGDGLRDLASEFFIAVAGFRATFRRGPW